MVVKAIDTFVADIAMAWILCANDLTIGAEVLRIYLLDYLAKHDAFRLSQPPGIYSASFDKKDVCNDEKPYYGPT